MVTGVVTAEREAVIRVQVQGASGQAQVIEAVIDTGFTGWLTLPPSLIAMLGLPWLTQGRALLANGQMETFDVYAATLLWDGQSLRVMVDEANTDPLIGMSLLHGYELYIQNQDGGSVTIQRIATP
ncbi:MAG: clan AA aspartic protease [Chloroflexota bacterium]|nr:clan AA aspartic protease [Chloroflexota bacterium]